MTEIPGPIREALLVLNAVEHVQVTKRPTWDANRKLWLMELAVKAKAGEYVPERSLWIAHLSEKYPFGELKFYPAKVGGPTVTFPHQNRNRPGPSQQAWREGDVCLVSPFRILGRQGGEDEPLDTSRLAWHAERLVEWVDAAARGTLTGVGQPFELPDFRSGSSHEVAFTETPASWQAWRALTPKHGTAITRKPWPQRDVHAIVEFRDIEGEIILEAEWGDFVRRSPHERDIVLWIRLDRIPIVEPWSAPSNWGELRHAAAAQGCELDNLLKELTRRVRDYKRHFLLVGFPIAQTHGAPPEGLHWQALRLPALRTKRGMRGGHREKKNSDYDLRIVLRNDVDIEWVKTSNWADDQLLIRGRLSDALAQSRIALLGGGAVGSLLVEPLVRGGLRDVILVDNDDLVMGNLVRHTLTATNAGADKVLGLSDRLRAISPHVRVASIPRNIEALTTLDEDALAGCDVIIDATGAREAPSVVEASRWAKGKLTIIVSVAPNAEHFYLYAQRGLVASDFVSKITPLLEGDLKRLPPDRFPREGLGCWHPVFPATHADVQAHAGIAAGLLDAILSGRCVEGLYVIEKTEAPLPTFQARLVTASSGSEPISA